VKAPIRVVLEGYPWLLRLFYLVFPFAMASTYIIILYITLPYELFIDIGGAMSGYFFPPFGKESVIPMTVILMKSNGYGDAFYTMFLLPFSIAFIDIVTALFLAWNFELALKIPILGAWMKKREVAGRKRMEESRKSGAFLFWGIVLFVMIPFQGSGGVVASILGRIAGLSPGKTVLAIAIGAFSGCFSIGVISYYAADALIEATGGNMFKMISILAGVIVLILIIYWIASNRKHITEQVRGAIDDHRR